jgi:hypothetical protein
VVMEVECQATHNEAVSEKVGSKKIRFCIFWDIIICYGRRIGDGRKIRTAFTFETRTKLRWKRAAKKSQADQGLPPDNPRGHPWD